MYMQISLTLILGLIFSVFVLVPSASAKNHTLFARQFIHGIAVPNVTVNSPAELPSMCLMSCTPMLRDFAKYDGIDGGTVDNFVQDEKCLCTDQMYAKLQTCTNCLVKLSELEDYVSQIKDMVQEFVINCKNSGNPVSNVTSAGSSTTRKTRMSITHASSIMTTTVITSESTDSHTEQSTSGTETATTISSTADVSTAVATATTQSAQSGVKHLVLGNLLIRRISMVVFVTLGTMIL